MGRYLIISLILTLSACSVGSQYETVSVVGIYDGEPMVRGMGVRLHNGTVLTSAHVVPDDRYRYMISDRSYTVIDRNMVTDRALLSDAVVQQKVSDIKLMSVKTGDAVSIVAYRSGYLTTLTGRVTDPDARIIGYDMTGKSITLSGIIVTDILLEPGESGAPIYNQKGELVDVVHISKTK